MDLAVSGNMTVGNYVSSWRLMTTNDNNMGAYGYRARHYRAQHRRRRQDGAEAARCRAW
jgi:hypothetical protein